jgi:hypothetical protein
MGGVRMRVIRCDRCGRDIEVGNHIFEVTITDQTGPDAYKSRSKGEYCVECKNAIKYTAETPNKIGKK